MIKKQIVPKMKFFLGFVLFIIFSTTNSFAQQPAYFVLAEEQFRGIQIYDIIQDNNQNYWISTSEGLYRYDFYKYEKVECDQSKNTSVFNLVSNKKGEIFCNNLSNQIFRIKNDSLILFYELSNSESRPDISIAFGDDGNLLIGAKEIMVLNEQGKVINRYNVSGVYIGPPFQLNDGKIQYHVNLSDSIIIYSSGKFSQEKIRSSFNTRITKGVFKFFRKGKSNFAFDLTNKVWFYYDPFSFTLTGLYTEKFFQRSQAIRIYETGDEIWIAGTLPGVTIIDNNYQPDKSSIYYEDYFISEVFKDKEGNILLGTFDKGILVIPDMQVPDVINKFIDDPINSLHSDPSLGLIIGSSKGKILNYNFEQLTIINDNGQRPIEAVYGTSFSEVLLFDNGMIRAMHKRSKKVYDLLEASLKDAVLISETEFYLGTNRGLYFVKWNGAEAFEVKITNDFSFRIYSLEYDYKNKILYCASTNGLLLIDSTGKSQQIKHENEDIFPLDMCFADEKLYLSTPKKGLFTIKGNQVVQTILPKVNDKLETIKKLVVKADTLYAQSSNGLFQFNKTGKLLQSLHTVFGFGSKHIIDFTFHDSDLFVSHSGGVQKVDLRYSGKNDTKPNVILKNIFVNDEVYDLSTLPELSNEQRKIQFEFSSPTLRNRQNIFYSYKLQGYDSDWNKNGYKSNTVTYSALAPGNYTLLYRIENQGILSPVQSLSFSIARPFYLRWWFIVLVALFFIAIVLFVYRIQINRQRKKSQQINELNASKLTAIQSQMNPHFIFNSLNSIQDLILKGDVEHSYSYITTFSNLVRRTLNYSEKDFIDFEQEIKLLELYLSLEKLRFKKDFNYVIKTENIDDIMLPPLLIQPFIENALVHGLLHKEGEKTLVISFELKTDSLICIVEDNGIGREKSKAIKQRQGSEHESFSGNAIRKRFEILSNVFEGQFGYSYTDLSENGIATGTKVSLTIPIKHKF